jgi:diadenosine tetraphosphate (Ap4A) HIT family hydrolase
MSDAFERLQRFLTSEMRMSHVYQPVMIQALLEHGGRASMQALARALLVRDEAQLAYYQEIVRNMPGPVLRRRGIVEHEKGEYVLCGYDDLSAAERHTLLGICLAKVDGFLKRRRDPWAHRRTSNGYLSGTLKYEVLKRARFRCELCGASADDRALEVDHIIPRNRQGSDDISNLQSLCYSCNAMKRDRDDTDFRGMREAYEHRELGCTFCEVPADRIVAENELFVAVRDAFAVTQGHTLLIPKRHLESPGELFQPELNAMWSLASAQRARLKAEDPAIDGFNLGFNDGASAGQTIMHAHVHLIPRRTGDAAAPRGGVRGVIPEKQGY